MPAKHTDRVTDIEPHDSGTIPNTFYQASHFRDHGFTWLFLEVFFRENKTRLYRRRELTTILQPESFHDLIDISPHSRRPSPPILASFKMVSQESI